MEDKRFAILIDADNISSKYIPFILEEIANYGVATYKRIYGDWTKPESSSWKDVLLANSITPIQQYSYTLGKNATDSAMIIDAMDILYSGNVDGFCIASSDSDFTKLSSRLRESAMFVIGMGERKTPKPFIASCNQFKYLDVLAEAAKDAAKEEEKAAPAKKTRSTAKSKNTETKVSESKSSEAKIEKNTESVKNDSKSMTELSVIRSAVKKMLDETDEIDEFINMGEIGSRLIKRYPDFDVRNYGDSKLSKFLKRFDFIEIHTVGNSNSLWVGRKKTNDTKN